MSTICNVYLSLFCVSFLFPIMGPGSSPGPRLGPGSGLGPYSGPRSGPAPYSGPESGHHSDAMYMEKACLHLKTTYYIEKLFKKFAAYICTQQFKRTVFKKCVFSLTARQVTWSFISREVTYHVQDNDVDKSHQLQIQPPLSRSP